MTNGGNGRYTAAEADYLAFPSHRTITAGARRGVMFCHGAQGSSAQFLAESLGYREMASKLADHGGCVVGFADLGAVLNTSDVWGNATGMTRMDSEWAWIKNASGGMAKTDKCILVGGSMGGLMCVNWAQRNPSLVAAVALIIPVLDLQDVYVNDRSGLQASISAAYGGAPDYATRSPMNLASGLAGIPTKIWYATDDPVTPDVGTVSTFAAAAGASTSSMGAVGHTFSAADLNEVLAFVGSYL